MSLSRRRFVAQSLATLTAPVALPCTVPRLASAAAPNQELIADIEKTTLRRGRDGSGPTWFHPRPCAIPGKQEPGAQGPRVLMTLQTISGSDYFGPVQWMESTDIGRTWTEPQIIPSLGRTKLADGTEEAVCDVVPEYHPPTRSVLAVGQSMFYRQGRFFNDQPPRSIVYATYKDGTWSEKRTLAWDDPRGAFIYTNNNCQRVTLDNGDVHFVMSCGPKTTSRSAIGVRCKFDGRTLAIDRVGREIKQAAGRGLLEPSLIRYRDTFYVTLRAEDQRGYVAASDDGLDFQDKRPWMWDDGEPITMSSTQQHWLAHSDGLFLVYTRKDAANEKVIVWRSPMFIAQVDLATLRLIRDTERVVFPLVGDGQNAPDDVALMGNHQTVNITPDESWVCDGEVLPKRHFRGDLLLGRIRWSRPNRLV